MACKYGLDPFWKEIEKFMRENNYRILNAGFVARGASDEFTYNAFCSPGRSKIKFTIGPLFE